MHEADSPAPAAAGHIAGTAGNSPLRAAMGGYSLPAVPAARSAASASVSDQAQPLQEAIAAAAAAGSAAGKRNLCDIGPRILYRFQCASHMRRAGMKRLNQSCPGYAKEHINKLMPLLK